MGADLLISSAWIKKDRKPDIKKGERLIQKLASTHASKWPRYWLDQYGDQGEREDQPADWADQLNEDLSEFVAGISEHRRDVSWIEVGPYRVYLTGGMSWGDPPTDAMEIFGRLEAAGVLDAMGFYKT